MEFTGKYAAIRKNFYKEVTKKFRPGENVYINGSFKQYKTEAGFRAALNKKFASQMALVDKIEATSVPLEATITVWYPERSNQARAKVEYSYMKNGSKHYGSLKGGPTGGWGYDKMSTALAEALNSSPEFLKILMDARARSKKLSYGVTLNNGKPFFPRYDGGVGTECYYAVFKECGYNVKYVRTGIKDSETYIITKRR